MSTIVQSWKPRHDDPASRALFGPPGLLIALTFFFLVAGALVAIGSTATLP